MYELPSTSMSREPSPRAMNLGVPPTPRNARTGEFTPPGVTFWARAKSCSERDWSTLTITTIGVDLAKNSFQLHGVDHTGRTVLRKKLSRSRFLEFFADLPACTIGMEACGGAHHWARELTRLGHTVRLMPPQYVKPDVKRNKHDAADAEACCEAVQRPSMRFIPIKSQEQQCLLMLHRIRDRLLAERTA